MTNYIGYSTHDPYEAEAAYVKRTGESPTVIVCRHEYALTKEHPLVRRCNNAGAGMLMVSHLIDPGEIHDGVHLSTTARRLEVERSIAQAEYEKALVDAEDKIPIHAPGRPSARNAFCPHCQGEIKNFEDLGFWYGWQLGIEPPYWATLRIYVFRRDKYTCQSCGRRLPPLELRCHHIEPKETGGTDSSRNMRTLCGKCHLDEHPVMPEENP